MPGWWGVLAGIVGGASDLNDCEVVGGFCW